MGGGYGRGEYIMEGEMLFELFMGDSDPSCVIRQGLTELTRQVGERREKALQERVWGCDIAMSDIAIAEAILEYTKNEQVLIDMRHQHMMLYVMYG